MNRRATFRRAGRTSEWWPVLLLLVLVVIPTMGVLWFVVRANRNERLASQQRLTDAYRAQLMSVQHQLISQWQQVVTHASLTPDNSRPARLFASQVRAGGVDALIIFDAAGQPVYPTRESATPRNSPWRSTADWLAARLNCKPADYQRLGKLPPLTRGAYCFGNAIHSNRC